MVLEKPTHVDPVRRFFHHYLDLQVIYKLFDAKIIKMVQYCSKPEDARLL